jgi:energy-coupling factor transporter ATP-binding protein EcfA2
MDKVTRLSIENFTVFKKAEFAFEPGVNTLIGANGTGKSHVLKLLYTLSEAQRRLATGKTGLTSKPVLDDVLGKMLKEVFQPDRVGGLVRRDKNAKAARIEIAWGTATMSVTLWINDRLTVETKGIGDLKARDLPPAQRSTLDLSRLCRGMGCAGIRVRSNLPGSLRGPCS